MFYFSLNPWSPLADLFSFFSLSNSPVAVELAWSAI